MSAPSHRFCIAPMMDWTENLRISASCADACAKFAHACSHFLFLSFVSKTAREPAGLRSSSRCCAFNRGGVAGTAVTFNVGWPSSFIASSRYPNSSISIGGAVPREVDETGARRLRQARCRRARGRRRRPRDPAFSRAPKCATPIPVRRPLLHELRIQATLDSPVRRIEFVPTVSGSAAGQERDWQQLHATRRREFFERIRAQTRQEQSGSLGQSQ